MIVWKPASTRSATFDPITKAVPMCMSPDGSSPTYARGVPVRSRRARNSSRVTTSSEPRNTFWRRSSRATDPPNLTRQDKGFNQRGGIPRQSNNGLKSRMWHPRPGIRMGGILGLFDLGSVTAFQGVDVVGAAVGAFIFLIFVLIFLFATLKVVKEYERIVNFRLGKAQAEKGPGIVVVIPGIDKPVRVDLRERFLTIPHQTCITKDNAPVDVDFIVYFKVASAADSVIRVNNFEGAAMGIATTTLRAVIGDIILDEVLSKREEINAVLRTKLDEVTTRWGVKVTNVEIREILPPKNVTDAMILQMSAERSRRGGVVDDGAGESPAGTIPGEGKKNPGLPPRGDRQDARPNAEGYAQALSTIFGAAKGVDEKTLMLQYLDALRALGASPATKFILPLEFTELIRPFRGVLASAEGAAKGDDR